MAEELLSEELLTRVVAVHDAMGKAQADGYAPAVV
jgi:hypothetical protein